MSTLQQQAVGNGEGQLAITARMAEEFRAVCRDAWKQGLLSGCNGNASQRLGEHAPNLICITRSGASKGRLTTADCCLMDVTTGGAVLGGSASTESGMHLAIYRTRPDCTAILHTHPRRLLALSLRLAGRHEDFLRLPLFEAEVWRARLGFAPALPPGTTDLAEAVAAAAMDKDAVWMAGHGLCCLGRSLGDALCLAEELEHLAALQILATV